ncbi:MAG: WYL domain-containing protein [Lachnospiraceae bacterium]|nr:WYL domain-containing protein [Lachnospiraceae bacterium]
MIFSELYSAYYNAVAAIINEAIDKPVNRNDIRRIVEEHAFNESILNIEPALMEERWQLLKEDGTTVINNKPVMPLTEIQKRWIRAICIDPRIKLFLDDADNIFPDVKPLFTPESYIIFDKYCDGDDYTDKNYIENFRFILDAIKNRYVISVVMENRYGMFVRERFLPTHMEYSEKDDKFRVIGNTKRGKSIVNIGRVLKCSKEDLNPEDYINAKLKPWESKVVFELHDVRNALDRVLLHFAHFEKEVEKIDDEYYKVSVSYNKADETEMVIRILSFGPMIKVTEPESFIKLIRTRLIKQKKINLKRKDEA